MVSGRSRSLARSGVSMKPPPVYRTSRPVYKLPASMSREIGRIIVTWAFFEHLIKSIIENLKPDDDESRELKDSLNLIRDLLLQRRTPLTDRSFERLKHRALDVKWRRDVVAHGLWSLAPDGKWRVRRTSHRWPKEAFNERVSRRDKPEGI